jgi:hypothetical protein
MHGPVPGSPGRRLHSPDTDSRPIPPSVCSKISDTDSWLAASHATAAHKANRSLLRRMLAIKYGNSLPVEPIRLAKRGGDADDSKLTELRESPNEVEDHALLCRIIEMQVV